MLTQIWKEDVRDRHSVNWREGFVDGKRVREKQTQEDREQQRQPKWGVGKLKVKQKEYQYNIKNVGLTFDVEE